MNPTVSCPKCNHENELGRVFCSGCGAKLDLSRIKARRFHARGSVVSLIVGAVRLALGLGLLVLLGLLFWPASPAGQEGSAQDAIRARGQLLTLARGVESGQSAVEIITEAGINAYAAELLKKNEAARESSGMRVGIRGINVSAARPRLTVLVLATWGGLPLSYELSGVPVVNGEAFAMKIERARWGHLPLPGAGRDWLGSRVAGVFSRMADERTLLDRLSRFDVGEGKVRLAVGRL